MRKTYVLAKNTFRESVRSKILYSIFFFALVVLAASAVFGLVTIGDKVKVLKDFGLFSINIFCVGYIVVTGSALLFKELNKKTIFNILSKPIRRSEFICGKFFGMFLTIFLMVAVMTLLLIGYLYLYKHELHWNLLIASYSIFLQAIMVCALVILISSMFVTPFLSGAITFGLFVIGRSANIIEQFVDSLHLSGISQQVANGIYYLLPNLSAVDVSNKVVHNFPIDPAVLIWNTGYAFTYAGLAIILASWFFGRREFN